MSSENLQLWRIFDANLNRATEGLRVVEEYTRFVLDDAHLSSLSKSLRHELATKVLELDDGARLLMARDTIHDVGVDISAPTEFRRQDIEDVLGANFKRIQQSLRCLEEYSKIHWPDKSRLFERMRYQSYTIERALDSTRDSLERLRGKKLYVLIDAQLPWGKWTTFVQTILDAGVGIVQLREKRLDDQSLLDRARYLTRATLELPTLFIMNDRPDLAMLSQADGVHLGQDDVSVREARSILGLGRIVGVSTHCIDQARKAVLDGADYIGVGPTFPSKTKKFATFPGLDLLRDVAGEISLPSFAIGGITIEHLPRVVDTGFNRVAMSSAIRYASDPRREIHKTIEVLTGALHEVSSP